MTRDDTIAAVATPPGTGAIGIVRISGPEAREIATRVFSGRLRPRSAVLGRVRDPRTGFELDEGLGILMPAPGSYTGEDVVELQGHGGSTVLRRVLAAVLAAGARHAEPGEFTLRAFLSGRIDLTQAESVLAVIEAKTDAAADIALAGLHGAVGSRVAAARRAALQILAYVSARADFPDEDVPLRDVTPELEALAQQLRGLIAGADRGILHREGVRVAIVGRPNAGKSSLLNRLLRTERAIVTPYAGTTRDTLEESANVLGLPVVYTDTAGMRESSDPIERIGVERSMLAVQGSRLPLLVLDASKPLGREDLALLASLAPRQPIVVLNKSDLGLVIDAKTLASERRLQAAEVSALTGEGIENLEQLIHDTALAGASEATESGALQTLRQKEAAARALEHAEAGLAGFREGWPEDLLSADLSAAVRALGELTGEDATEDLLDVIFSRFCIGK